MPQPNHTFLNNILYSGIFMKQSRRIGTQCRIKLFIQPQPGRIFLSVQFYDKTFAVKHVLRSFCGKYRKKIKGINR